MSSRYDLSERDMLDRVCAYFANRQYECRRHVLVKEDGRFFELDLICDRGDESNVIEIKSANKIHPNVIRRIISKMQSPSLRTKRFYICIPASSRLLRGTRKLLKNSGIGIITVERERVNFVLRAQQVDRRMMQVVNELTLFLPGRPRTRIAFEAIDRDIIKSFSQYIYTMRVRPYPFRLSRELLDKMGSLKNVGYADLLRQFKTEYERGRTRKDENEVVLRTLKKLWAGKYGKRAGAKAFESFSKFEPILKAIPGYRDHMIHPFQVFLMGALIIDEHYNQFKRTYKRRLRNAKDDSLDFSWLLCSTFHDFCYPIQMYEKFNERFFLDFLESEVSPILLQTEKLILDNDHLRYIDQLAALYTHLQGRGPRKSKWNFDFPCKIDDDLRSEMIEEVTNKNHALLSAIALLKKILMEKFVQEDLPSYLSGRFSTDVYPAALAIALHDEKMLCKLQESISFENAPLVFLLVYCDLVQECGRLEQQDVAELYSFHHEGNIVESTLIFGYKRDFKRKTKEIERIFARIESKAPCFKVNLRYSGSTRSENSCKSN